MSEGVRCEQDILPVAIRPSDPTWFATPRLIYRCGVHSIRQQADCIVQSAGCPLAYLDESIERPRPALQSKEPATSACSVAFPMGRHCQHAVPSVSRISRRDCAARLAHPRSEVRQYLHGGKATAPIKAPLASSTANMAHLRFVSKRRTCSLASSSQTSCG